MVGPLSCFGDDSVGIEVLTRNQSVMCNTQTRSLAAILSTLAFIVTAILVAFLVALLGRIPTRGYSDNQHIYNVFGAFYQSYSDNFPNFTVFVWIRKVLIVNIVFFLPAYPLIQMISGLAVNSIYTFMVWRWKVYLPTPRQIWSGMVVDVINIAERFSATICVCLNIASFVYYFKSSFFLLEIATYFLDVIVIVGTILFFTFCMLVLRREALRGFSDSNMRATGNDLVAEIIRCTCAMWNATLDKNFLLASIICSQLEKLNVRALREIAKPYSHMDPKQDVKVMMLKICKNRKGLLKRVANRPWILEDLLRFGDMSSKSINDLIQKKDVIQTLRIRHDEYIKTTRVRIAKELKGLEFAMEVIWSRWTEGRDTLHSRGLYALWGTDAQAFYDQLILIRSEACTKEHFLAAVDVEIAINKVEHFAIESFTKAAKDLGNNLLKNFTKPFVTSLKFEHCNRLSNALLQHSSLVSNGMSELLNAILAEDAHDKAFKKKTTSQFNQHITYLKKQMTIPGQLKSMDTSLNDAMTIAKMYGTSTEKKSIAKEIKSLRASMRGVLQYHAIQEKKQGITVSYETFIDPKNRERLSLLHPGSVFSKAQQIGKRVSSIAAKANGGKSIRPILSIFHDRRIKRLHNKRKIQKVASAFVLLIIMAVMMFQAFNYVQPEALPPVITTGDCEVADAILPNKCKPIDGKAFPHSFDYIYKSYPGIDWVDYNAAHDFLSTFFNSLLQLTLIGKTASYSPAECMVYVDNQLCSWLYPPCTTNCEHGGQCLFPCTNAFKRCFTDIDVGVVSSFLPGGAYYWKVKELLPNDDVRYLAMTVVNSAVTGCTTDDIIVIKDELNCASKELEDYLDICYPKPTTISLKSHLKEIEETCPLKEAQANYYFCQSTSSSESSSTSK
eukprot:TRINITY_DN1889_c0_g1_i1.p1 TRINITY_DN1889_c0_g1~~TRINITY_DN1889_c0_g1_i1.p1  ORF type:complete len:898 (-),score=196.59 TRINITY_DN1889_c0_g1_i1:612-3305(-)